MRNTPIALAADHAGYYMKEFVARHLIKNGYKVKDFGTYTAEDVDYPDYAHPLGEAIDKGEYKFGLVFCGTGNGVNITVNKHQGVRSAICWNNEIAELVRRHNDANVCAVPSRFVSSNDMVKIIDCFLNTEFEGERHARRVAKIPLNKI